MIDVMCYTGDGLPDMATQEEVVNALKSVGFEVTLPSIANSPRLLKAFFNNLLYLLPYITL